MPCTDRTNQARRAEMSTRRQACRLVLLLSSRPCEAAGGWRRWDPALGVWPGLKVQVNSDFRWWHEAPDPGCPLDGRFRGANRTLSRHRRRADSDPQPISAAHPFDQLIGTHQSAIDT